MANQERLADNTYRFAQRTKGAPRQGRGLLTGLAVCGRCGHQMRVAYKPALRYFCAARRNSHATPACLHLDGSSSEATVVEAFFTAIHPAELHVLEAALLAQQTERARLTQHYTEQVTRAEYEARLAERQDRAVDPDNRLVAAELESRWELALRALATAHEAAARFAETPIAPDLDPKVREQLSDLSSSLPSLWASGRLRPEQQKDLLRSLIRRVVLTRPLPDTVEVKIIWVSGVSSLLTVHPPVGRSVDLSDHHQLVNRVGALSAEGSQDREIARRLAAEGFQSAHHTSLPLSLVRAVRTAQGQASLTQQFRGQQQVAGRWTVSGLAQLLGVRRHWLYAQIQAGKLPAQPHPLTGRYFIDDDPALLQQLREQVAAKHLH